MTPPWMPTSSWWDLQWAGAPSHRVHAPAPVLLLSLVLTPQGFRFTYFTDVGTPAMLLWMVCYDSDNVARALFSGFAAPAVFVRISASVGLGPSVKL